MLLHLSLIRTKNKSGVFFAAGVLCCFLVPHHFFLFFMYARVTICGARVENLSYEVLQFLAAPQHTARRHARTVVRACMHAWRFFVCMYVYVRKTGPKLYYINVS